MSDANLPLAGNLAAAPEIQFSQKGTAYTTFTVMVNKRQEQNGQWVDVAKNGMRCVAFGDLAENIAESLDSGQRVIVTGRLEPQQWQDKQTGENRYGWQLVAEDVGPSLRWATARPQKANRQAGGAGGHGWGAPPQGANQQSPQADPWGTQQGYDDPPW